VSRIFGHISLWSSYRSCIEAFHGGWSNYIEGAGNTLTIRQTSIKTKVKKDEEMQNDSFNG